MSDKSETESPVAEIPEELQEERMLEAILFASAEPVSVAEFRARIQIDFNVRSALQRLMKHYEGRGVKVVRVGDAWAMRTAEDLSFLMKKETRRQRRLSQAAMETLAIIAYHQPTTRAEIEEIRGVSMSKGTIDQLIELEWVNFGQRRQSPGRPVTFVTTRQFLDHFGLESVRDLPGLKELQDSGLLFSEPSAE